MSATLDIHGVWRRNVSQRRHLEDDLQRDVFQFLRWALPDDAMAYHVPNGGLRHKKAAQRLVGLGVRSGIPDIAIVHRGRAIFIELKAKAGVLSPTQKQMHRKLVFCGAVVLVCRSLDDVERGLRECGLQRRAGVAA